MNARHTPRNVPRALVDCACETTAYSDGSGVEIHFCSVHEAAPELLAALKELCDWIAAGLNEPDGSLPDAECLRRTEELAARARAAVDKAEGTA